MWFRNLVIYRLPADWNSSAAELEERLGQRPLQACGPFDMLSKGWIAPSSTGRLVHTVNQRVAFALTDKLVLKRLEFLEMAQDSADGAEKGCRRTVRHRLHRDGR